MKKNILLILITAIICVTGTSYAVYKLQAKEVSFDKSKTELNGDTVQDSIDEMVDMLKYGDAEEGDIVKGKTALVNGKKITGNFDSSEKIPSIRVSFTLECGEWNQITIPYIEYYKSVSIFNGSTSSDVRTLLIYKGSTQIGTLTNGQNATYNMEDKKSIVIKTKNESCGSPYGYFVLNP